MDPKGYDAMFISLQSVQQSLSYYIRATGATNGSEVDSLSATVISLTGAIADFTGSGTSIIRAVLAFGSVASTSGAAVVRCLPLFPLLFVFVAASIAARFARASWSLSKPIIFAFPSIVGLGDRRGLASSLTFNRS